MERFDFTCSWRSGKNGWILDFSSCFGSFLHSSSAFVRLTFSSYHSLWAYFQPHPQFLPSQIAWQRVTDASRGYMTRNSKYFFCFKYCGPILFSYHQTMVKTRCVLSRLLQMSPDGELCWNVLHMSSCLVRAFRRYLCWQVEQYFQTHLSMSDFSP